MMGKAARRGIHDKRDKWMKLRRMAKSQNDTFQARSEGIDLTKSRALRTEFIRQQRESKMQDEIYELKAELAAVKDQLLRSNRLIEMIQRIAKAALL
jgi:hypothetical protein